METSYTLLRTFHIACGMIALLVAPGAMIAVKGALWHRRWGKIYFWAMALVTVSALAMSLLKPNPFLLMVALFSFYLAFCGYRALYHKHPDQTATVLDWSGMVLAGAGSVGLLAWAATQLSAGIAMGWVGLVFGVIGSVLVCVDSYRFFKPAEDRRAWFYRHMIGMLSAYIATVSAFSVVNFKFLPPLVRWLWVGVVGGIAITLWVGHYKRRAASRAAMPVLNS